MNEVTRLLMVAFGIGLVIFVHELGHFLAARWCKVRVEVFSLGFGPRLFGWTRGGTLYQIAALPLGGFVKMFGEEREGGAQPAPDSLHAKSVGQRFLIYSGGVIMNMLFALIVFPIVLAIGVPMNEPVVGDVAPGSPAWHARIQEGTRILAVNDTPVQDFLGIRTAIALGSHERTELLVQSPGSEQTRTVALKPEFSGAMGLYTIGIGGGIARDLSIAVAPGSPAERAGLRERDRLLRILGAPEGLTLEEGLAFVVARGAPLELEWEREENGTGVRGVARLEPQARAEAEAILGVAPEFNLIRDLRDSDSMRAAGLERYDVVLEANGRTIRGEFDLLLALLDSGDGLDLVVQRGPDLMRIERPALDAAAARALHADLAVGPNVDSARIVVRAGSSAESAGLQDGDTIAAIDGRPIGRFAEIRDAITRAGGDSVRVLVRRTTPDGPRDLEYTLAPKPWGFDYGIGFQPAMYTYQARDLSEAVSVGLASSWRFLAESFLTLVRMFQGNVSSENLGGIITIGVVSHSWAGLGLAKLFFFLCMLSVNLAFLNVLPIPVLDGGHLAFLLIEKLKGSPVSERVQSASQIVGLVLVGLLVLYVTYNDIQRLIAN